ncbi:MAG: flagellin lysine-N-methylase [Lachnospiraceae bacterium]|nr:flagellin lysine-N-methylase [Lachnospiraceae bacterium]
MKLIAPDYYTKFQCIADRCRHSCCIGWVIDVDADTLEYYHSVEGTLGERLKNGIDEGGETPHFILGEEERCPFLNQNGLCDIITELGEGALCQICTDHPRYRNFYSDRTEIGLGLCCEAAGELILKRKEKTTLVVLEDDGENEELDVPDESLLTWREQLFAIAQNRNLTIEERVVSVLNAAEFAIPARSLVEWADIYLELERLEESWTDRLQEMKDTDISDAPLLGTAEWEIAFEQLLVYFLYRQLPFALDDGEYEGRAAFCVLSYRIIRDLCRVHAVLHGGVGLDDLVDLARQYSAEIEYSDENVEALLDALFEE